MVSLFKSILEITALSSILIVATLTIRKLFSKSINIKILTLLWVMVLARLIVPFSMDTSINIGEIIPSFTPNNITAESNALPEGSEIDNTTNSENTNVTASDTQSNTTVSKNDAVTPTVNKITSYFNQINIMQLLSFAWLAGMLIALIAKSRRMYIFSKKISLSREIKNDRILLILSNKISLINLKRKVIIYECDYIDAPLTYGVLRPKILIPVGFISSLSDDQQKMIILHELYHIKNLDVAKNYLWLAAKIIYWFNPLINLAYKAYIEDTETSCDAMVLNTYSSDRRQQYSQSLIDITKLSKGEMILPVALSFCEDKSTLRKRVEYMIKPTKKKRTVSIVTLLIAVIIVMFCFTTACLPKAEAYEITFSDEIIHVEYEIKPEDNVTVTVNADVAYPENDTIPIIGIEPKNISYKQLEAFIDYVLEDTPVYYKSPYYIDDKHSHGDLFDGTIVPLGEYTTTYTELFAFTPDEKQSYLQLEQTPNDQGGTLTYWRFDDDHHWDNVDLYQGVDIENMEKSHSECLQIAEDLIVNLTGKDNNFEVYDTLIYTGATVESAYKFYFRRVYSGIPSAIYAGNVYERDPYYYQTSREETITITVDDEGVFEFYWDGQFEETGIIEQNAKLLDFDDVMKMFNDYCKNNTEWNEYHLEGIVEMPSIEIDIDSIELRYVPITEYTETTNMDSVIELPYELTPVWLFVGNITVYLESNQPIKLRYSQINIIATEDTVYE